MFYRISSLFYQNKEQYNQLCSENCFFFFSWGRSNESAFILNLKWGSACNYRLPSHREAYGNDKNQLFQKILTTKGVKSDITPGIIKSRFGMIIPSIIYSLPRSFLSCFPPTPPSSPVTKGHLGFNCGFLSSSCKKKAI